MNYLYILFLFLFYFENNSVSGKYYYVKKTTATDADCSEDKPCNTISDALFRSSSYDTIYINGDLDEENSQINIIKPITVQSITAGSKVNIPFSKKTGSEEGVNCIDISIGYQQSYSYCGCIIKDFKFTISSKQETNPRSHVILVSYGFVRLESVEFVREKLDSGNPSPLSESVISGRDSSGDVNVYLHTCTFTGIELESDAVIENVVCAMYNCQFNSITRQTGAPSVAVFYGCRMEIIDTTFDTCKCLNCEDGVGGVVGGGPSSVIIGGYNGNTVFRSCSAEVKTSSEGSNAGEDKPKSMGGALGFELEFFGRDFNITNVEFGSESNANKADIGANIFMYVGYIYEDWDTSLFPILKDADDTTSYYALYCASREDEYYPLRYLLDLGKLNSSKEVYVGGSKDDNDCKSSSTPCASIEKLEGLIIYGTCTVIFVGDYNGDGISFPIPINLKNFDSNTKVNITSDVRFSFHGESRVEGLTFYLPSSYENSEVICSYERITLKSLTFTLQSGVNECICSDCLISLQGEIEMDGCSFSKVKSTRDTNCGIVHINYNKASIKNCSFTSLLSPFKGGALYLQAGNYYNGGEDDDDENSYSLSLSSCTFKQCSAKYGSAIYLFLYSRSELSFKSITFGSGNERNIAEYGQNIFLESYYIMDIVTTKNFPMLSGLNENSSVVEGIQLYSCIRNISYIYDKDYLFNMLSISSGLIFAGEVFVGGAGDDAKSCKDKSNLCKTFEHAIESFPYNKTDITVVGDTNLTEYVVYYLDGHEFRGENKDTKLTALSQSRLYVNHGTIRRINIHIGSGDITAKESPFINAEELKIYDVKFTSDSNVKLKYSLIFVEGDTIEMKGCSFTNIVNELGQGSCLCGVLIASKINSTTFEGCSVPTTEGNEGGAMLVSLYDHVYIGGEGTTSFKKCSAYMGGGIAIEVEYLFSFELKGLSFGTGDNANSATCGKNMVVTGAFLEKVADYDHFPTLKGESEEDNHLYDYYVETVEGFENGSLIKLINGKLKSGTNPVYIGDDGEGQDCSSSEKSKLCSDINNLAGKVKFDTYNITVVNKFTVSYDFECIMNLAVKGEKVDTKIIANDECSFKICAYDSFSTLIFEVGNISNDLFVAGCGKLTLSSCTFKPENKTGFLHSSLISISYADALIENCVIGDFELDYSQYRYFDYGCAISVDVYENNEVSIRGVNITNCRVINGGGGGIYASVLNGSTFRIEKSKEQKTFIGNCAATKFLFDYVIIWNESLSTDYGVGGGIYLGVDFNPKKLLVDCEFGSEEGEMNEALQGYDLFLLARDIKKIMTYDNFPFLEGKGSDYNGAVGYEISLDGEISDQPVILVKLAEDNDKFPVWAIVLIVMLVIVVIGVIVVVVIVIVCVVKKRKGGDSEKKEEMGGDSKEGQNKSDTNKE